MESGERKALLLNSGAYRAQPGSRYSGGCMENNCRALPTGVGESHCGAVPALPCSDMKQLGRLGGPANRWASTAHFGLPLHKGLQQWQPPSPSSAAGGREEKSCHDSKSLLPAYWCLWSASEAGEGDSESAPFSFLAQCVTFELPVLYCSSLQWNAPVMQSCILYFLYVEGVRSAHLPFCPPSSSLGTHTGGSQGGIQVFMGTHHPCVV